MVWRLGGHLDGGHGFLGGVGVVAVFADGDFGKDCKGFGIQDVAGFRVFEVRFFGLRAEHVLFIDGLLSHGLLLFLVESFRDSGSATAGLHVLQRLARWHMCDHAD